MVRGAGKQVLFILSTFVLFDVGLSLKCLHTTDTKEWSLSAVCWKMSLNRPNKCQWYVFHDKKTTRVEPLQSSPSSDTLLNCSVKLPLPLSTGEYTYRILLAIDKFENAFNLRIEDPGELTIKNCKHEVSEGDNVTCVCSTQQEGNPPPVISWVGQTKSSTLHLYEVTGEHSKTYTCEMIWGNQTKTVSHDLLVNASDEQDDSFSTSVIFITVATMLVITIATTIILIVIVRRKRRSETQQSAKNKEQGILSQHSSSYSGHGEEELIENRYYGGFDIVDGRDFKNVGDDYAEVMEAKSMEPDLYAGIKENNERQTTEPVRYVEANKGRQAAQVEVYAIVEKNKGRQPLQPELYATVVKFSGKEQAKTDNSRLGKKDFVDEENVYTIVDKGAKPENLVISAPVEEMYSQVVKSPK